MTVQLLPSDRLITLGTVLACASFALLVFPEAGLLLAAVNLTFLIAVLIDYWMTPGPDVLKAVRRAPERVSILSKQRIAIDITNTSALAVRIRDDVAPPLRPDVEEIAGVIVPRGQTELSYGICPASRGRIALGALYLRYRSILGFWERAKTIPADAAIQVYPAVDAIERYQLLAHVDQLPALGIRRLRIRGASWEFESLREFVNGDDIRLMDWKATAERRKLIVRSHRAERNQAVIVLVDSGRLMTAEDQGVSKLDHAVNAALLLAHVALSRGDRVGLCSFSGKVHSWLAPRAHLGQMRLIAEALYDLHGDFTESDHARCLRMVGARHNKRALLVVLTDFVDADTAAEMVASVRHAARRHVVLFTAFKDPFVEKAGRLSPKTEPQGFQKAVALDLLRERREVLERLRRSGVQAIDAEPTAVTPNLLNKYLEISLRGLV